ncbi:MAG: hydroxyacylglutathione hydrolase [Bdellovibrionales bacterium]
MSLKILQIPIWEDNYIYLLHEKVSQKTAVIDPAEAGIVNQYLQDQNWKLDFIFNTHHHHDHVGGNRELKKKWGCKVFAYQGDAHRIPGIDATLKEGDEVSFGKILFKILFVPGHTSGHIAYWSEKENLLFCGDCLFAMGCGRLFEGTPEQMFNSLSKIKKLKDSTMVYCAHEYSLKNAQFSLTLEKDNILLKKRLKHLKQLREQNRPTVPFSLKEEKLTNPFLKAKTSEEFAKIRSLRDQY